MRDLRIPDDLSIPAFLDVKNPDVRAAWERARAHWTPPAPQPSAADAPVAPVAPVVATPDAAPLDDAATRKKHNALAALKARKAAALEIAKGGRFDPARNRFITPEEDYAAGAARIGLSVAERLVFTRACAALDPDVPDGIAAHARALLAGLDGEKLAVETAKAEASARRYLARQRKSRGTPRASAPVATARSEAAHKAWATRRGQSRG